jgi:multiple sugar transport system permease protein
MKRPRLDLFKLLTPPALIVLAAVNLIPLALIARQALTPPQAAGRLTASLLPPEANLANLRELWMTQPLLGHIGLSLWVAFATTILSILLGFPAGWAAARWRRLTGPLTRFALISRILPPIAVAIPLAALFIPVGLYNHPAGLGLILAHLTIGLPFAILLAFVAFRELPPELEEAAYVDGSGAFGAFVRVALPAVRGTMGGAFILIFLLSWDEFPYALIIQLTHRTMPPLVYYYTEYGHLGAASTLAAMMLVPALAVIAALQRLVARGATGGGVNE